MKRRRCLPHKDQQRGEEGKNDCIKSIKRMAKKVRKSKGRIVVLFFKVK